MTNSDGLAADVDAVLRGSPKVHPFLHHEFHGLIGDSPNANLREIKVSVLVRATDKFTSEYALGPGLVNPGVESIHGLLIPYSGLPGLVADDRVYQIELSRPVGIADAERVA